MPRPPQAAQAAIVAEPPPEPTGAACSFVDVLVRDPGLHELGRMIDPAQGAVLTQRIRGVRRQTIE